jgi:hypothetical protein
MRVLALGWAVVAVLAAGSISVVEAQNTTPWPEAGNVGIGITKPTAPLHVFQSLTNPNNLNTMVIEQRYSLTSTDLDYNKALDIYKFKFDIPDGVVDTGYQIGLASQVFINDTEFAGTINQLFGIWARVGIYTAAAAGARTVTNAYGVYIDNLYRAGTITNNYGLYQSSNQAKNYFAGNVGIGTTAPTAKLHVAGDAIVSGNIAAKYQDVAEWVPARMTLSPGTVVVIDPEASNHVLAAVKPYDTRVAGVVSAQPGLLLGDAADGKIKVAHMGRVRMKVDASLGAIAVGDLLVTSSTPGHAMRSAPVDLGGVSIHRPGTVVGKALEPLAEGQGEILVLLTLQ